MTADAHQPDVEKFRKYRDDIKIILTMLAEFADSIDQDSGENNENLEQITFNSMTYLRKTLVDFMVEEHGHDALQTLAARGEVAHRHPLPVGPYIFRRADLTGQHGDRLRAIVRSRTKRNSAKTPENGGLFD